MNGFDRCAVLRGVAVAAILLAGPAAWAMPDRPGGEHRHGASSAGTPGDAAKPARPVPLTMRELPDGRMAFVPAALTVQAGEQVRFVLHNAGGTDHEFVLATPEDNVRHARMMHEHPDMTHAEPNARRLAPQTTADLVWRFTTPGTYEFACLIPGHYEAGMHGTVTVR